MSTSPQRGAQRSESRAIARGLALLTSPKLRALLTVFDQGVVSLANFAVVAIVGKACDSRAELGLYGLGFMIVTLTVGIPKALVQTPYTTKCPGWSVRRRRRFSGSAAVHSLALALLGAAVLLLVALGSKLLSALGAQVSAASCQLPLILAPVLVMVTMREHARRVCLAWHAVWEVVAVDLAISIAQVTAVGWLAWVGRLNGSTALLVWGGANGLCACWYLYRRREQRVWLRAVWAHAAQFWGMARWLLAGAVAALIVTSYYRVILSAMHGLAAMGSLTSAQSLVMIANPIVLGIANYLCPAMATTYAEGGAKKLVGTISRTMGALIVVWIALLGGLWLLGGEMVQRIFGDKYAGLDWEILVIGLGFCSESLAKPIEAALTAAHRVRQTFYAGLVRLALTLTLGAFLVWKFDVAGIGYAMVIGNGALIAIEFWMFRQLLHEEGGNDRAAPCAEVA